MKSLMSVMIILAMTGVASAGISNFDDLTLAADSHWNGSDETGDFTSGPATFNNNYNTAYSSWDGWAYSNKIDTTTPGFGNQYSAITGGAQSGNNYGVAFTGGFTEPSSVTFVAPIQIVGMSVTNSTYAALDMQSGSAYSKKFGGVTGDDEDWFLLTITGLDAISGSTGTVAFYLADYRSADNSRDYVLDTWDYVDLSSLGVVSALEFALTSSDNGIWGMNTPAYFAMDDLTTVVPEPMTFALLGLGGLLLRRKK